MVRLNPRSFRVLNQDGASDMMHSVEGADHVGAFLREARETTGRTVADVAQNLRIRRVYLEAIEDGRFDELPGATYAVGFVRSYAAYLRLDAPTLVARFKDEASGIQAPQELEFPTPVPEGRFPGGLLVTVCLLLGAAAFGGWYWFQSQKGVEVARVPAPPGDSQVNTETSAPPPDISVSTAPPTAPPSAETTAAPELIPFEGPMSASESAAAAAPTISAPDDSAPVTDAPDVPPVPPSEVAAGASSAPDTPTEVSAAAETPVSDVTRDTVASDPATADVVSETNVVAETPAPDARNDVVAVGPAPGAATSVVTSANAPPTGATGAPEPEVAMVTPGPPAPPAPPPSVFSSEPAIIALPEIEESQATSRATPDREGRTYGARNAAARIILHASENTWVQIRDSEENVLLTQMLQAGDRYLVPNRDGLRLMTGNAGGLDIAVDGDLVPAIGARGESRRDVRLDANLLKTGGAVVR